MAQIKKPKYVDIKKGLIIKNRYKIIDFLSNGGLADIYIVEDITNSGDKKVMKTIPYSNPGENDKKRIENEIQTFSKLISSKYVTPIYDFGIVKRESGDFLYLIIEHMAKDFKSIVDSRILSNDEAIHYFTQIAKGMRDIQNADINHRDLKPGNVLVSFNDELKISDFGTSKILGESYGDLSFKMMTRKYAAPEQLMDVENNENLKQVDIYAFGVMLYEAITGANVVNFWIETNKKNTQDIANEKKVSKNYFSTVIRHKSKAPIDIDQKIYPGLSAIAMNCLIKDYKNRYQSFDEILEDLEKIKRNPKAEIKLKEEGNFEHLRKVISESDKENKLIKIKKFTNKFGVRYILPTVILLSLLLVGIFIVILL
ncbi:serine/threonine-protein kinase [Mesoplasma photuris]|uniref:serine/threonine-protein kinase n=1 Tax=Mesoplasma photuris TaxID=217731 RepID=UPI0004E119A3|nr:serine/threonine-protein kinase [Mesoplasma photuris]